MSRRMIIMLATVGVVLGGVFGFQAFSGFMMRSFFASQGEKPQAVSAITVRYQTWQPNIEAVGSLRASSGADLSAEVSGIVSSINFKSGDDVQAGALLLSLNAADDIAKLHSLSATADLAAVTYRRSAKLFQRNFVSKEVLDTDLANLKNAQAQVAEQQAVVDKKNIRAPFAGRLGLRSVDLGQFVNAGTSFVTLQSLDPMFIDFFVPQQALDRLKAGLAVRALVDTYPTSTFAGSIDAINSKVDADSRNVQVRASFANPEHKLLPGMFATVTIDVGAPQRLLTVPQTAISFNPYGSTVYVIENMGKDAQGRPLLVARQTFVTTGATRGNQIAILKGVKEGATVVTTGQLKLRNASPVAITTAARSIAAVGGKDEAQAAR